MRKGTLALPLSSVSPLFFQSLIFFNFSFSIIVLYLTLNEFEEMCPSNFFLSLCGTLSPSLSVFSLCLDSSLPLTHMTQLFLVVLI